jgi:transcriptional regulator NrdR family protein
MMNCPLCGSVAHTRSSRYLTDATKERYHQCRNINCSCTFATHESVARVIVKPEGNTSAPQPPKQSKRETAAAL